MFVADSAILHFSGEEEVEGLTSVGLYQELMCDQEINASQKLASYICPALSVGLPKSLVSVNKVSMMKYSCYSAMLANTNTGVFSCLNVS